MPTSGCLPISVGSSVSAKRLPLLGPRRIRRDAIPLFYPTARLLASLSPSRSCLNLPSWLSSGPAIVGLDPSRLLQEDPVMNIRPNRDEERSLPTGTENPVLLAETLRN